MEPFCKRNKRARATNSLAELRKKDILPISDLGRELNAGAERRHEQRRGARAEESNNESRWRQIVTPLGERIPRAVEKRETMRNRKDKKDHKNEKTQNQPGKI